MATVPDYPHGDSDRVGARRQYGHRHSSAAERVVSWLGYLATHLDRLGTQDLAWWQLRDTIPRRIRFVVPAVLGLMFGVVVGIGSWLWFRSGLAFAFGPVVGLALGVSGGFISLTRHGPPPVYRRLTLHGLVSKTPVLIGLVAGLIFGGWAWYETGLVAGLSFGAFPLLVGLVFGFSEGIVTGLERPIDLSATVNSLDSLKNDRRTAIGQLFVLIPLFALAGGVTGSLLGLVLEFGTGLADGVAYGLAFGCLQGMLTESLGAWGQWLMYVRLWPALTGRLPWPVLAFLTDAYNRGVLRQAGPVFQFRHARLQDHLGRQGR